MMGLCCCTQAFSSAASRGCSLVVLLGLLIAMVSLFAEHGLYPGLLGEGFGCGFLKTATGYSNENSVTGKEEHCMDFQGVF